MPHKQSILDGTERYPEALNLIERAYGCRLVCWPGEMELAGHGKIAVVWVAFTDEQHRSEWCGMPDEWVPIPEGSKGDWYKWFTAALVVWEDLLDDWMSIHNP